MSPRALHRHSNRRPRDGERGAVAVLAAIFLLMLFTFFAIAFSMGQMMDTRTQLQAASDSAALAAARSLNGEADGLVLAREAAGYYTSRHRGYDEDLVIDEGVDVEFGRWHFDSADCVFGSSGSDCFEVLPDTVPRQISAVRVWNGRDGGTHNSPLPLAFGGVLSRATSSLNSFAIAVGGGAGNVACALPISIAECKLLDSAGNVPCGSVIRLTFSSSTGDNGGFINLYPGLNNGNPTPNFVEDQIRNRGCRAGERQEMDDVDVHNGLQSFNGSFVRPLLGLQGNGNNWNPDGDNSDCVIGTVQTIAISDGGGQACANFVPHQNVQGFLNVRLLAVSTQGGSSQTFGSCLGDTTSTPYAPPAGDPLLAPEPASLWFQVECEEQPANGGGDAWGGGVVYDPDGNARVRLAQ
jgi:hypothetical protein